jgi:mono/diheme cytochrome c family protein
MVPRFPAFLSSVAAFALAFAPAGANEPPADALAVLEQHCVQCHGGDKTKGGLNLATRDGLMKGGETGPAISKAQPKESFLLKTVRHEEDPPMPHKKDKLSGAAIRVLEAWVTGGTPYARPLKIKPEEKPAGFTISEEDRRHWAFRPVQRTPPPSGQGHPVDAFIRAGLEARGLELSPEAKKETLLRRLTFDLVGLPPTPQEIDAFVNDRSPSAYERLVDRLLASPAYGERWGRHWLDLARYAETDGFEHDAVRPHSWRYRDYVIAAFNADKPYDRFTREQIAGDELWPGDPEALTATGFNLLGPDMVDSSDQIQRRHNTLNDMTDTIALAFLGLTMGCARCHDHKFEPISQRDYYSLQACFTPAMFRRDEPIPTPDVRAKFEKATDAYHAQAAVRALAELEAPVRTALRERKLVKLSPEARSAHETPAEERNGEQANLVLETQAMVTISDKDLNTAFTGELAADRKKLLEEVKRLPKPEPLPKAMALANGSSRPKSFVLVRGEYSQPGDEVPPAAPTVLGASPFTPAPTPRTALANWLASPENPLTARVLVNRVWQHHFGRGLVGTPSDFGTHGQKPTHPELLDWLASEFMAQGWSIKRLHKLLLMSDTYRQTSAPTGESARAAAAGDPENRLYWRMNRQRLEGEAIRDSLLSISGQLNSRMGGPSIFPPIPKALFEGAKGWSENDHRHDYSRRSIYIFARRNLRFPFLEVFDAPDGNLSCPSRERSTTAPQALTLLNAVEVTTAATATAERIAKEARSEEARVTLATRLILGRAPQSGELALARQFLARSPFSEFCRALFNLNDFIYVE